MRKLIPFLLVLLAASAALADRYEYDAEVNIYIPEGDSTGVRDTINIPDHIQIDDINFYVGVGLPNQPWGEAILIDVFSPQGVRVRLNDWGPETFYLYDVWYDTEREEDGPGQLEDYNGGDAFGPWEMFCFDPFQGESLTWYTWRIEVIANSSGIGEQQAGGLPKDYAICAVYPNPFNSETAIKLAIPKPSQIRLEVYDICGRKVKTLISGSVEAGYQRIIWDGTGLGGEKAASGIYLIRLAAGERQFTRKAVILK
jgi:subtilisin-like proprotein convertase family protein